MKKSSTSDLWYRLSFHPQIVYHGQKEVSWFRYRQYAQRWAFSEPIYTGWNKVYTIFTNRSK